MKGPKNLNVKKLPTAKKLGENYRTASNRSEQNTANARDNSEQDVVHDKIQNDDIEMSSSDETEGSQGKTKATNSGQNVGGLSDNERFREYEEMLLEREDIFYQVMKQERAQIDELLNKHRKKDDEHRPAEQVQRQREISQETR